MTPTELYNHISETEGIPMQQLNPLQANLEQIAKESEAKRQARALSHEMIPDDIAAFEKQFDITERAQHYESMALDEAEQIVDYNRRQLAYTTIIKILSNAGEVDKAKIALEKITDPAKSFKSVLVIARNNLGVYSIEEIAQQWHTLPAQNMEDCAMKLAEFYLNRGDSSRALALVDEIGEQQKYQAAMIMALIVKTYVKEGRIEDAEEIFSKMDQEYYSSYQEARLALLEANFSEENLEKYISFYRGKADYREWGAVSDAACLLVGRGQIDRALAFAESINEPSYKSYCYGRMIDIVLKDDGDSNRAEELILKIEVDDYREDALRALAVFYAQHNQPIRGYDKVQHIHGETEKVFALIDLCEAMQSSQYAGEAIELADVIGTPINRDHCYVELVNMLVGLGEIDFANTVIERFHDRTYCAESHMLIAQALRHSQKTLPPVTIL